MKTKYKNKTKINIGIYLNFEEIKDFHDFLSEVGIKSANLKMKFKFLISNFAKTTLFFVSGLADKNFVSGH